MNVRTSARPTSSSTTLALSGESSHHWDGFADEHRHQFRDKALVILGTEYAGEMKKGVFTVMNYFAPKRGVLSMHCSPPRTKRPARLRCSSASAAQAKRRSRQIPSAASSVMTSIAGAMTASSISRGLLRESHQPHSESEPDIFQALRFGRCWRTWCSTRIVTLFSPIRGLRKTRAAHIQSNSSAAPKCPALRAIRPT